MLNTIVPPAELADEDLRRRVVSFLASRQLTALQRLDVEARGGTVTLRGQVATLYEKQISYLCSRRVAGVVRLNDEVQVAEQAKRESAVLPVSIVTNAAPAASAV